MTMTHPAKLLLALLAAAPVALLADVKPAPLFTDHAVLQRDKPVPVWGTADAGEKVTVSFAGQTKSATADVDGRWSVTLDPLPASATPNTLTIAGKNTVTLSDIVVGEVWLASGQSNMEWSMRNTFDQAIDVPASANPLVRHIKIKKTVADAPASTVDIDRKTWELAGPSTTSSFSAVAYYFARDIQALTGVPVGIVNSSWGGTPVEAWIDAEAYKTVPEAAEKVAARWEKALERYPASKAKYDADLAAWNAEQAAAKAAGQPFNKPRPRAPQGPGHPHSPAGLYNAMIHPLVPYALRGAIWYQGESNAGRASEYRDLFSAMITGWRAKFGQGDFPFYWVQLANYSKPADTAWAFLREAQTQTLSLPNTGQAVIIDIGDQKDIHPRNKKDVGRRLARLALKRDYGFDIIDSGPVFEKAEREGAGFRVHFKTAGKLRAPLNDLPGFELAGEDKVFKTAEAKLDGNNTVVVTSAEVPHPVAVRYAWRNAPVAGLINDEGLPAVPFRTDTW